MQASLSSPKSLKSRVITTVDLRLKRIYGIPRRNPSRDAVSQLVVTILSQATTDVQTARSFGELRRRFPTWEQVRDARASELAKAIRSSGLSNQKAPRIKAALKLRSEEGGRALFWYREEPALVMIEDPAHPGIQIEVTNPKRRAA